MMNRKITTTKGEIMSFLFDVFFLVKTWCLHYPQCNSTTNTLAEVRAIVALSLKLHAEMVSDKLFFFWLFTPPFTSFLASAINDIARESWEMFSWTHSCIQSWIHLHAVNRFTQHRIVMIVQRCSISSPSFLSHCSTWSMLPKQKAGGSKFILNQRSAFRITFSALR